MRAMRAMKVIRDACLRKQRCSRGVVQAEGAMRSREHRTHDWQRKPKTLGARLAAENALEADDLRCAEW
jgi:hypothetical protein